MTNQDYVTFDTAKLLKEAGYPQKACRVYDSEGDILDTFSPVTMDEVAAPHLWDAMKWLREHHGLLIYATYSRHHRLYYPNIHDMITGYKYCGCFPPEASNDYDTVLEAAVKKAIQIIKDK